MKKAIQRILFGSGTGETIGSIIDAAMKSDAALVRDLLDAGADINTVDPARGYTCLHIACLNGDDDVVDVLLAYNRFYGGLDFWLQTNEPKRYAWQLAMSAHHYDLAERVDAAAGERPKPDLPGPRLVR